MTVCLTTYIYGEKYQSYIPLVLYSLAKSYPEYRVIIFLSGKIDPQLQPALEVINKIYSNYKIVENTFDDCKSMSPLKARSFRWVLWDDEFLLYDYLYYIDSDLLFVKEPVSLAEQHIKHMNFIGSDCVSNILRKKELPNSDLYLYLAAIKHAGLYGLLNYPFNKCVYRMSGLHFVKVSSYFSYFTRDFIREYKRKISTGKAFREILYPNDEALLYHMMKVAGCNMSIYGIQTTSASMFGIFEPMKQLYCPHHGIHMGIFRIPSFAKTEWTLEQLNSNDYLYYAKYIADNWFVDSAFLELYSIMPDTIKDDFMCFCEFYNIEFKQL